MKNVVDGLDLSVFGVRGRQDEDPWIHCLDVGIHVVFTYFKSSVVVSV